MTIYQIEQVFTHNCISHNNPDHKTTKWFRSLERNYIKYSGSFDDHFPFHRSRYFSMKSISGNVFDMRISSNPVTHHWSRMPFSYLNACFAILSWLNKLTAYLNPLGIRVHSVHYTIVMIRTWNGPQTRFKEKMRKINDQDLASNAICS